MGLNPANNDPIFIYGSATAYTGGIVLRDGQKLFGQDMTVTLAAAAGITLPPFSVSLPLTDGSTAPNVSITNSGGDGVTLNFGNTLRGFSVGNCSDFGIENSGTTSVGNLAVSEVGINNGTGGGFDASHGSGASMNAVFSSISSLGGTNGINLTNCAGLFTVNGGTINNPGTGVLISGGSVVFSSSVAISDNSGFAVDISSHSGNATFFGNITSTGASIRVQNCGGGTKTFSGSSKSLSTGTSTAVTLSNNSGATINFTNGGLNITTTTGTGFSATGGGTVTVQGTGNTINSISATALNVANTTIGASGLTFQSISSGNNTAAAEPANGIVLNSTGSSGGLTVTGDGSNTTKGGNASGGTIQNIFGSDATTAGIGIYLNNTANVVLRRMTINGTLQNNGIYGELVNNLTMQYCTVGGTIGTTSGSNDLTLECPVQFGKTFPSVANGFATGSAATIDNCLISGGIQHNMEFYQVGNTASVTISNCNITSNGAALGSDGIQIETHTDSNGGTPAANFTVSVQSCLFDDNKSQALQASALGDSFMDITINNCTVQKTTQGNEGFVLQNGGDGDMTAHVTNNTLTGILGANIFLGQVAGNANAGTNLIGVISGNTMTVGAVGGPYPINRTLIVFLSSTVGQVSNANILVHGNTIHTQSEPGVGLSEPLFVSTPDANTDPSFTATVTNNVVNIHDPGAAALRGIAVQSTQTVSAGCFDVRGNDVNYTPSAPMGVNGLRVRQAGSGTAQLEQGTSAGAANVVLAANNPLCTTEVVGTVTVVSNGTCQEPPN